jgi:hypothetical protein
MTNISLKRFENTQNNSGESVKITALFREARYPKSLKYLFSYMNLLYPLNFVIKIINYSVHFSPILYKYETAKIGQKTFSCFKPWNNLG